MPYRIDWVATSAGVTAFATIMLAVAAALALRANVQLARQAQEERKYGALDDLLAVLGRLRDELPKPRDPVEERHETDGLPLEAIRERRNEARRSELYDWIDRVWSAWEVVYSVKLRRLRNAAIEDRVKRFHILLRTARNELDILRSYPPLDWSNEGARIEQGLIFLPALESRMLIAAHALQADLIAFEAGEKLPRIGLPHADQVRDFLIACPFADPRDFVEASARHG